MVPHFTVAQANQDFKLIFINPGGVADGQVIYQGRFINPTTVSGRSLLPKGPNGQLIWIDEQVSVQDVDHLLFTTQGTTVYRVEPISPDDPPCDSEAGQAVTGDYAYLRGQAAFSKQGNAVKAACWFRVGAAKGDVSSQRVLDSMKQSGEAPPGQAMTGGPLVANASFESPSVGGCPNFQSPVVGGVWQFVAGGITAAGCRANFITPPMPSGAGAQVGFLQSSGNRTSISQTVSGFQPRHAYQLTFYAAGRKYGADCARACPELSFSVFAGPNNILDVDSPPVDVFELFTTLPFAASGSETISFAGAAKNGVDQTSFVDMVKVEDLGACEANNSRGVAGDDAYFRGAAFYQVKDYATAICWLTASAAGGNANAEGLLAFAYYSGTGIKRDYNQAFAWAQKAGDQGNRIGAECLWLLYRTIAKNPAQAESWHQKALAAARMEDAATQIGLEERNNRTSAILTGHMNDGRQLRSQQYQGGQNIVAEGMLLLMLGAIASDDSANIGLSLAGELADEYARLNLWCAAGSPAACQALHRP